MSVYKRGKFYSYCFEFGGQRIRCSTKQANKETAKSLEAAHRVRLASGDGGIARAKPAPQFADYAWGAYWEKVEADHAAKAKTLAYHRTGLRLLSRYAPLQGLRLSEIDGQVVDGFAAWARRQKAHRKTTNLTVAAVNRALEVLRHMLRLAARWDLIRKPPVIVIHKKGERSRDRIISHSEEGDYLRAAADEPELLIVATAMADCAWRPEEAFRFAWDRTHFEPQGDAAFGWIHNDHGKSENARRDVPMTQRLSALLQMRWEQQGKPKAGWVFPRPTKSGHVESLGAEHEAALAKSGIADRFVIYSLRHTALTRLAMSGCDVFTLQKIAGHADIRMSAKYVHPTPKRTTMAFADLAAYNAAENERAAEERKKERVQ